MNDLLVSKGFELREYPDGFFWVWEAAGRDDTDWDDYIIYQCTDSFEDFTRAEDVYVDKLSKEEFIKAVEKL